MDENVFLAGIKNFGLLINELQLKSFKEFSKILVSQNKKMNLTSINDPMEISVKHFLDSISILSKFNISHNLKIADIGTGGGFPSVPIKIMRPDLDFLLVEANAKKVEFLKNTAELLRLDNFWAKKGRAEELSHLESLRNGYDICLSRAVAPLKILAELCIPFVKIDGFFIAYKSNDIDDELTNSLDMIENLGATFKRIEEYTLPLGIKRKLIFIKKIKETPIQYPRKYSKIKSFV